MSWGSHSHLLEGAIIYVQALGDQTNPSVLLVKYNLNINKTCIFTIQIYFWYFSLPKMITAHFSMVVKINWNSATERKFAFILQMNRTEPLIVTATNSRWLSTTRWLVAIASFHIYIIFDLISTLCA